MSFKKVYEIAEKYAAKTIIADNEEKFQSQKEKLAEFFHLTDRKLSAILNEMQGDLLTLKYKGFPKNEWKELFKIHQEVVNLRNTLDSFKIYESAQKIIDTISERSFRARLNTLEVIIQHFLKSKEVHPKNYTGDQLQQSKVNSLKNLVLFTNELKEYMQSNPIVDPQNTSTIAPPRMKN
jgi:AraC-like DNA-binding protein